MGELASYLVEEAYDEEPWMVVDETVVIREETAPWEEEWQGQGDWVEVGPNGLVCQPHGDVRPYVRLELWSGEPPLAEPAWDRSWTGEIFLRSGKIQLMGYFGETDFPPYIYRAEIYKFQFWRPIAIAGP